MSEYTILNVIPTSESQLTPEDISSLLHNRTEFQTDTIYMARFGGDERERLKFELLSQEEGELVYELPIQNRIQEETTLANVIISYYEDTGDHFESTLYEVTAFSAAEQVDFVMIHDDYGSKIESYYQEEFGISTKIRPP